MIDHWYDVRVTGENDVLGPVDTTVRVRAFSAVKAVVAARSGWIDECCLAGAKGLTFRATKSKAEE